MPIRSGLQRRQSPLLLPQSAESVQPFPPLLPDNELLEYPPSGYQQENIDPLRPSNVADQGENEEGEQGEEEEEVDDSDEETRDDDFLSHYSSRGSSGFEEGSSQEDDDDEGEEDDFASRRPLSQSTSSLLSTFAPPFYNRPPTPLPPSPSLTSLLRPSFSATTSRPTTPDSSDVETPNDTEAVVAKSARNATTVPRASPKVPTYEYYGFVLYLASSLAFSIPSFLVMTLIYIYIALAAYNTGYLTLPMDSIENLVDDAANIAVIDSKGRRRPGGSEKMNPDSSTAQTMGAQKRKLPWAHIWDEGTDAVMDIPIGGVCEVLYGTDEINEYNT
ncbi:hypothetical protein FQN57_001329 [Myotisia sp. PD_48]|nr:hypothetical protein FQN57_001329 [Myotisia sp. PD_48]